MNTRTAVIVVIVMAAAMLAASAAFYSALPESIPTHWNLQGRVDGWSAKPWAAFMLPAGMLLFLGLIAGGQWLSPVNFKVEPFRPSYNYLMTIAAAMMAYLHAVILFTALNPGRNTGRWLTAGIFLFFAAIGNLLGKTRRNFWVGIRTPWALADERVWLATHRLGAWFFCAAGILGAAGVVAGIPPEFCLAVLGIAVIVPVVYSFWLAKKLEKESAN